MWVELMHLRIDGMIEHLNIFSVAGFGHEFTLTVFVFPQHGGKNASSMEFLHI